MQTDVEERKYEFAVLRTLGLRNNSLITLITIQSLFFSVPGIILGFTLKVILLYLTQLGIISMTKINLEVQIESRTVLLGVITGLFIPFLSNIAPIKQALGTSLRNALDKFRPSIDDVEVQMVRFENQGLSFNQVIMSITLLVFGIVTYYFVPQAAVKQKLQDFMYLMNALLLLIILGLHSGDDWRLGGQVGIQRNLTDDFADFVVEFILVVDVGVGTIVQMADDAEGVLVDEVWSQHVFDELSHLGRVLELFFAQVVPREHVVNVFVDHVDDVVLVGGASRMPHLRHLIQEYIGPGKKLHTEIDPDITVAYGAANILD
jgi:hypothetical protein